MLHSKTISTLFSPIKALLTIADFDKFHQQSIRSCRSRSFIKITTKLFIIPFMVLVTSCSESDSAIRGSNSGSQSKLPTANTSINLQDGSLILTNHSQSITPPSKISVLFNVKTETGKPVANLMLDDFDLYEDGQLSSQFESQPQIIPEENEFTYSTLLLLDFSASVISNGLDQLKTGAAEFIYSIMESNGNTGIKETAIAIFDGSSEIYLKSDFLKDTNALLTIIENLSAADSLDSSTNLYGAIVNGINQVENQLEDNATLNPDLFVAGAMVLFSDGRDLAARVTKESALKAVQNSSSNIALFTIGLGDDIDVSTLDAVGKNGFQQVDSLSDLVASFTQVGLFVDAEANSFYKLEYCSPRRAGSNHELKIVVYYEGLTGSLKIPFSAEQFTAGCTLN